MHLKFNSKTLIIERHFLNEQVYLYIKTKHKKSPYKIAKNELITQITPDCK